MEWSISKCVPLRFLKTYSLPSVYSPQWFRMVGWAMCCILFTTVPRILMAIYGN